MFVYREFSNFKLATKLLKCPITLEVGVGEEAVNVAVVMLGEGAA